MGLLAAGALVDSLIVRYVMFAQLRLKQYLKLNKRLEQSLGTRVERE